MITLLSKSWKTSGFLHFLWQDFYGILCKDLYGNIDRTKSKKIIHFKRTKRKFVSRKQKECTEKFF